jgi:2,4-dienoyl-CoA reductase-like NADH-dependent reductase (Old Yellow Enzyme family)/pyruvate/2-oxoglutarate dehydrogenase complex dihydrolipoamide dehydrogenase (E3) component
VTTAKYPHVFQPIRLGPIDVSNRFYFAPHGIPLTTESSPSDDAVYYFGARSAGGVGLIIHSMAIGGRQIGRISPLAESRVDSFAALAQRVHDDGAKIFAQLHHSWPVRNYQWEPFGPTAPSLSASVNPRFDHFSSSRAMSTSDIKAWLESFRRSLRNIRAAGYDGVEIHCTHGMLLEHFLSPYFNRRADEYGGSLENRLRLVVESLEIAHAETGGSMAIGMRYNCDEMLPGGMTQDDAAEALAVLVERKLLHFVDLDIAIEPNQFVIGMPTYMVPPLTYESFVKELREAAGPVPVLSALGRVTSIAEAERVISEGTADMVGAARGLIAEPDLVRHAADGQEERSRTCIACNWCLRGDGFGCAINPTVGIERRWGSHATGPATKPGRVVVVGGGPGGLEAARTAAVRGHSVVILERRPRIGGQLNLWATLPGREVLATTPAWYERSLPRLGVEIRFGITATTETVLAERPDAVIIATGSRYHRQGVSGFMPAPIPGWDRDFVLTPEQVLEDGIRPRGRVVVLDDEAKNTGAGVAAILAENGAQVELITRWLQPVNFLIDTLEFPFVIAQLRSLDVKISTQEYIKTIGDHELTVFDVIVNSERRIEGVDAVVLVNAREPVDRLADELEGRVAQVFAIGDALAPRSLAEAVHEGHRFARMLGEPSAPRNFTEAWNEPVPVEAFARPARVLLESATAGPRSAGGAS